MNKNYVLIIFICILSIGTFVSALFLNNFNIPTGEIVPVENTSNNNVFYSNDEFTNNYILKSDRITKFSFSFYLDYDQSKSTDIYFTNDGDTVSKHYDIDIPYRPIGYDYYVYKIRYWGEYKTEEVGAAEIKHASLFLKDVEGDEHKVIYRSTPPNNWDTDFDYSYSGWEKNSLSEDNNNIRVRISWEEDTTGGCHVYLNPINIQVWYVLVPSSPEFDTYWVAPDFTKTGEILFGKDITDYENRVVFISDVSTLSNVDNGKSTYLSDIIFSDSYYNDYFDQSSIRLVKGSDLQAGIDFFKWKKGDGRIPLSGFSDCSIFFESDNNRIYPYTLIQTDDELDQLDYIWYGNDGFIKPLGEPGISGSLLNTSYLQPKEVALYYGSPELGDLSGGVNNLDAKIIFSKGDYIYDVSDYPNYVWDDDFATRHVAIPETEDAFYAERKIDLPSEIYPIYAYDNLGDTVSTDFNEWLGYGFNPEPVRIYQYNLQYNLEYTVDNFTIEIDSPIVYPNTDRILLNSIIRENDDVSTYYNMSVSNGTLCKAVSLDYIEIPESVFTYDYLINNDYEGIGNNQIKWHFNTSLDDIDINMKIYPKIQDSSLDYFYLLDKQWNNVDSTVVNSYTPTRDFYYHYDDATGAGALRLPRRNLVLEAKLVLSHTDANPDYDFTNKEFILGPILYIGSPDCEPKESGTGLYELLDYAEINATENTYMNLTYDYFNPDDRIFAVPFVQDDKMISLSHSINPFIELSVEGEITFDTPTGPSILTLENYQTNPFEFNISNGHEFVDSDVYYELRKGLEKLLEGSIPKQPTSEILYQIQIDPKQLPNSDNIANKDFNIQMYAYHINGTKYTSQRFEFAVEYFLDDDYYDFDIDSFIYENNDVSTNSYTEGSINVTYDQGNLGYNYLYDLTSADLDNIIFKSKPSYRVIRGEPANQIYTPLTIDPVRFQFNEKPLQDPVTLDYYDTLTFNVKTPILEQDGSDYLEEGENQDGTQYVKIFLKITSNLDYTNIHCLYTPDVSFRNAGSYNYSFYIFNGDVYEKSDIKVSFSGDYLDELWEFDLDGINKGVTLYVCIYGEGAAGEELDLAPFLYAGIGATVFFIIGWAVIGGATFRKKGPFKRMDNKSFYIVGGIITAGVFIAILLPMIFLF